MIKFTFTAYNSLVENWILWLPVGNVWYVENSPGSLVQGN